jgi:hypothetical protein
LYIFSIKNDSFAHCKSRIKSRSKFIVSDGFSGGGDAKFSPHFEEDTGIKPLK